MKRALLLATTLALCGFAQAVNVAWTNRYGTGYGWGNQWGNGKNTAETPLFTLNTTSTPSTTVFTNTSGFQGNYMVTGSSAATTTFDTITTPMKLASIVLCAGRDVSLPNNVRMMLKQGENTYISNAVVRHSGNANMWFCNATGGQQTSGWSETFTFEQPIDFSKGVNYEVYLVTNAEGTLATDLTYTLMLRDNALAFDAQLTYDPVPEPTALALLALGVAGLALRRKIA